MSTSKQQYNKSVVPDHANTVEAWVVTEELTKLALGRAEREAFDEHLCVLSHAC